MMRFFAFPRIDGGVSVVQCVDGTDPEAVFAKYSEAKRALYTGAFHEINEADYRAMPKSGPRDSWKFENGALAVDAAKKAEIEARPKAKTLEQRVAELEKKP